MFLVGMAFLVQSKGYTKKVLTGLLLQFHEGISGNFAATMGNLLIFFEVLWLSLSEYIFDCGFHQHIQNGLRRAHMIPKIFLFQLFQLLILLCAHA